MSRYATRQELVDEVRRTIATDYHNTGLPTDPDAYNMAGLLRDLGEVMGDRSSGWTFRDPCRTPFPEALRRNLRPSYVTSDGETVNPARQLRLREHVDQQPDFVDGSENVAALFEEPAARFLLVETNLAHGDGGKYLTLHDTADAAGDYHASQESVDEWAIDYLVDLDTGQTFHGNYSVTWQPA